MILYLDSQLRPKLGGTYARSSMPYQQRLSPELAERLSEIGGLLAGARDMKYSLADLGPPGVASAAAHDSAETSKAFGNPTPGQRPYFLADVWLMETSHHLAALGTLYRQGEVMFGPLPLARTVLELSARVVYVLDPRTNTRERVARAAIEDAYATQEMAKAAKRLHGSDSDLYRNLRERVRNVRAEMTTMFESPPEGSPEQWQIEGQTLIKPTDAVERLGELQGLGRTFVGLYDRLSTHTHPSLGSLLFLDRDADGRPAGLTVKARDLEAIAQNTLAAWYPALEHFIQYAGWDSTEFDTFSADLENVFPGIFVNAPDDPGQ